MVALQIISKCLAQGNLDILDQNQITADYFVGYESEIDFILDHHNKYGNVPDKATFLAKFPDIELVEVAESDRYLVNTIREEYLYYRSVPVLQKAAKMLADDANVAAEYMVNALKDLQPNYDLGGIDIVEQAKKRYEEFMDRKEHQNEWFFTTGFPELDDAIHGIKRTEELFVLFARTNQGKSWVLEKICTHIWEIGFNVGYISPEMGDSSIGYRFDTLFKNFDNKSLMWGNNDIDEVKYKEYIEELSTHKNKFLVATSKDFNNQITIGKLRNWVKANDLHILAVDGITYLSDERSKRGDNKTTTLTNISEDLMALSIELNIPVLVVVQANRSGAVEGETEELPELESIRDSDGIAHNASVVISLRQTKDNILMMQVKKQRVGTKGGKFAYQWNPNVGQFDLISLEEKPRERSTNNSETRRKHTNQKEDLF